MVPRGYSQPCGSVSPLEMYESCCLQPLTNSQGGAVDGNMAANYTAAKAVSITSIDA